MSNHNKSVNKLTKIYDWCNVGITDDKEQVRCLCKTDSFSDVVEWEVVKNTNKKKFDEK